MVAWAMASTPTRDASATQRTHTHSLERRPLVGDRQAMWRGSRRDEDWVRRFNRGADDVGAVAVTAPLPGSDGLAELLGV